MITMYRGYEVIEEQTGQCRTFVYEPGSDDDAEAICIVRTRRELDDFIDANPAPPRKPKNPAQGWYKPAPAPSAHASTAAAGDVPSDGMDSLDYAVAMLQSEFMGSKSSRDYRAVAHHFEAIEQWKREALETEATLRAELDAAQERERRNLEWTYALMVELAVVCLEETNRTTEPADWPNGQEWSDLVGTSRSIFMHKARSRAGIDHDEWRKVFEPEVDDKMVDIWERKAQQPRAAGGGPEAGE